jgi:hypothetical protein
MITKVGRHRQFAAVQGRITHSDQAVLGSMTKVCLQCRPA